MENTGFYVSLLIENAGIIKNAVYYSDKVGIKDRDEWHGKGMSILNDADLVFCDPDNGPIGKTYITVILSSVTK